jgi:hypothetical protein
LTTHEVFDGLMKVEFSGEEIEHVSTDNESGVPRPKWTEMYLYEVEPGQSYVDQNEPDGPDRIQLPDGGFFVYVIGQSVTYHRPDARHRGWGGVPVKVADFPSEDVELEDAWPCWICNPPVVWRDETGRHTFDSPVKGRPGSCQVDPQAIFSLETPWPSLTRAHTPSELVRKLHDNPEGRLLGPSRKLLQLAAKRRPDIQAALDGKLLAS